MSPAFNSNEKTLLITGTFTEISFEIAKQIRDLIYSYGQIIIQILGYSNENEYKHRKNMLIRQLDIFGITYNSKYKVESATGNLPTQLYDDVITL